MTLRGCLFALGFAAGAPAGASPPAPPPTTAATSMPPAPATVPATVPATATAEAPPAPLACLARFYAGEPARDAAGAWSLRLPDGTAIPFDDGKKKSFEETLASPDVQDAFSIPYRTGKIEPVTVKDHDPGRIRLDALFAAAYGPSEKEVRARLVPVAFLGQTLSVHRKVEPAFRRLAERLEKAVAEDPSLKPFLIGVGGTFTWRPIAGTDRPSSHSYGVSLDINVARSHYWRWQKPPAPIAWRNAIPQAIVDAFEAEGFVWGGRWYHYDTMHFEYRPELLDPACAAP